MKVGNLLPLNGFWYKITEIDEKTGDLKLTKREATSKAFKRQAKAQAKMEKLLKSLGAKAV